MNCRRAEALLSPWLDTEIQPAADQALAHHLAQCARCPDSADVMREVRARIQQLPMIEASPDFDARVWSRIQERAAAPLLRWLRDAAGIATELLPRWATAIFVAAALTASFYWASQPSALQAGQQITTYADVDPTLVFSTRDAGYSTLEWAEFWRLPWGGHDG